MVLLYALIESCALKLHVASLADILSKCKFLPIDGIVCYYAFVIEQVLFYITLNNYGLSLQIR